MQDHKFETEQAARHRPSWKAQSNKPRMNARLPTANWWLAVLASALKTKHDTTVPQIIILIMLRSLAIVGTFRSVSLEGLTAYTDWLTAHKRKLGRTDSLCWLADCAQEQAWKDWQLMLTGWLRTRVSLEGLTAYTDWLTALERKRGWLRELCLFISRRT